MKPIKVSSDGQMAMVIGLEENQVVAMLLDDKDKGRVLAGKNLEDSQVGQASITLGFGPSVQSPISTTAAQEIKETINLDLSDLKLDRAPFNRLKLSQQLYSGYLRLDLCEPLLRGNFIVLKGDKLASGKDLVIESAITHFLQQGDNHRVVYVSLNALRANHISTLASLTADEKSRLAILSADEYTTGDCEQYLAPM